MGKFEFDRMLTDLDLGDDSTPAPKPSDAEAPSAPSADSAPDPAPVEPDDIVDPPEGLEGEPPRTNVISREEISEQLAAQNAPPGAGSLLDVYDPDAEDVSGSGCDLNEILLADGIAKQAQITAAETVVKQSTHLSFAGVLLDQGVEEVPLMKAVARASGLSFERLDLESDEEPFDGTLLQRLGVEHCKRTEIIPLRTEAHRVVLGTSRPDDIFALDDTRLQLKARSIKVVVVPGSDIRAALELLSASSDAEDVDVDELLSDIEEDDVQISETHDEEVDLEREAAESPVIRYVNYIIQAAVKDGASDIHIEPSEKTLKVRFRIDGVLFESMQPPGRMGAAITSRLKIMANLDIAERRVPQDGRIRCTVNGRKLDLRVSTLPTAFGEKVVMRILDTKSISVGLDDLGFDENTLHIWRQQVAQPHGIILVTGPTGSGKTTTLYASLRQMDKKKKNVSTVEDPIEYHLDGITQTQTHEKINMTFSRALKALLRQDPDVIMIGEIRDIDTAVTAVQAALTGHLVLSTLHTNDAPSSITRLVNIGIEPFLIGAAVNAALAQRLVRRICPSCKKQAELSEEQLEFLETRGIAATQVFTGEGCPKCRATGYQGRVGIYELLVIDDLLRDKIARNPNVTELRRFCTERGMNTLREDGITKVTQGLTTIEEILRVTESSI